MLGVGAGAGVLLCVSATGRWVSAVVAFAAVESGFFVLALTVLGRAPVPSRRVGFAAVVAFVAAFRATPLLLAERAAVFFPVNFTGAFAVERAPAFALAALGSARRV